MNPMTVIKLVEFADGSFTPHAGWYVKGFDPDYHEGVGFVLPTKDKMKAKRFESPGDALDFWKTRSKVRPFRPDGLPNRPMTAYTIEVEPLQGT
jgi:hypothetical protein